jgi:hypothetical protein
MVKPRMPHLAPIMVTTVWVVTALVFDSAAANTKSQERKASQKKTDSVRTREIYSAMEPEPGPGSRQTKKQTLKNLEAFDPVPAAQREPISRRLKLIEKLIVEHGRAYDYRAVTLAELNAILAQLNSPGAPQRQGGIKEEHASEEDAPSDTSDIQTPKKKIQIPNLAEHRPEAPSEDSSETSESGEPEAPLPPTEKETAQPSH